MEYIIRFIWLILWISGFLCITGMLKRGFVCDNNTSACFCSADYEYYSCHANVYTITTTCTIAVLSRFATDNLH